MTRPPNGLKKVEIWVKIFYYIYQLGEVTNQLIKFLRGLRQVVALVNVVRHYAYAIRKRACCHTSRYDINAMVIMIQIQVHSIPSLSRQSHASFLIT